MHSGRSLGQIMEVMGTIERFVLSNIYSILPNIYSILSNISNDKNV
jgi:hypothetical protein